MTCKPAAMCATVATTSFWLGRRRSHAGWIVGIGQVFLEMIKFVYLNTCHVDQSNVKACSETLAGLLR